MNPSKLFLIEKKSDVVAHAYNPKYRSLRQGNYCELEASLGYSSIYQVLAGKNENLRRNSKHLPNTLKMVVYIYNSRASGQRQEPPCSWLNI